MKPDPVSPPFLRMLTDLGRAQLQWDRGNHERARAILQILATTAKDAAKEPKTEG